MQLSKEGGEDRRQWNGCLFIITLIISPFIQKSSNLYPVVHTGSLVADEMRVLSRADPPYLPSLILGKLLAG